MPTKPIDPELVSQAHEALVRHGSVAEAARALKIPRQTLQNRLKHGVSEDKPKEAKPAKQSAGRSLADFRAEHDKAFIVPQRIREGLKALAGGWEYEANFCRLCGVSLADLGNFRDEFADYIVVVRRDGSRRAWAATPALAERMRVMVR